MNGGSERVAEAIQLLGDRLTVGHLPLTQTVQVRILVAQPIVSAPQRLKRLLREKSSPMRELFDGGWRNSRRKFGRHPNASLAPGQQQKVENLSESQQAAQIHSGTAGRKGRNTRGGNQPPAAKKLKKLKKL